MEVEEKDRYIYKRELLINDKNMENFRGLRKVVMVDVLEGNGKDIPFRIVHYIYDLDQHGGSHGGMVGKIDNYLDQGQDKA